MKTTLAIEAIYSKSQLLQQVGRTHALELQPERWSPDAYGFGAPVCDGLLVHGPANASGYFSMMDDRQANLNTLK